MSSKKKRLAKGLGAGALAVATIASGMSFGAASASAAPAPAESLRTVQLISQRGPSTFNTLTAEAFEGNAQFQVQDVATYSTSALAQRNGIHLGVRPTGDGRFQLLLPLDLTDNRELCLATGSRNNHYFTFFTRCIDDAGGLQVGTSLKQEPSGALTFGVHTPTARPFLTGQAYSYNSDIKTFATALAADTSWIGLPDNLGDAYAQLEASGSFDTDLAKKATVSGTAEPDATVTLKNGTTTLGTTTAAADGTYSFDVTAPNKGGALALTVTQTIDGKDGGSKDVSLDYGKAVAITGPEDQEEVPAGSTAITGSGEAGSDVQVFDNSGRTPVISAKVRSNGTWSGTATLTAGEHTLEAKQLSKGANTTTATVTVNPGESANAELTAVVGEVDHERRSAAVSGTATPGAQIRVGATTVATAAADGSWSGRLTGLRVGANAVELVQFVGGARVDAVTVDIRVVATGFEVTSPRNNDVIQTADRSVTFTGVGAPGGKVSVLNGNRQIGTATVRDDGTWSFTATMAYTDYDLTVYYKKVPTGAVTQQQPLHITVTNNQQNAPFEVTTPANGSTVVAPDKQVEFTGTGTTGGMVTIKKGSATVGTADVDGAGRWSFTGELNFATHNLTAYYKKLPTSSAVSMPLTVTVTDGAVVKPFEVTSPASGSTVETEDKTVTFTGHGAGGGKVVVKKGNTTVAEGSVGSDGDWAFSGVLNYGTHDLTVFHKAVGSTQTQQSRLTVTVQAPPADFAIGSPSNGDTVAAGPVTFSGVGVDGTVVSVFVNARQRGTATVADGKWSLETSAIGAGTHDFVVYHKQGAAAAASETVRLTLR